MCCVHTHPGFMSSNRIFRAKRVVPAERNKFAAWNVEYQDFICHSIRSLAWFLPEAARFSETSSENLPKVHTSFIIRSHALTSDFSPYTGHLWIDWTCFRRLWNWQKWKELPHGLLIYPSQDMDSHYIHKSAWWSSSSVWLDTVPSAFQCEWCNNVNVEHAFSCAKGDFPSLIHNDIQGHHCLPAHRSMQWSVR